MIATLRRIRTGPRPSIAAGLKTFVCLCLALIPSGCGMLATRTLVLEDAVGPKPGTVGRHPPEGTLIVYSAWDSTTIGDPDFHHHTDYSIFSEDGRLLKRVENRIGESDQSPASVTLPPGHYRVEARASAFGTVSVPLVVREEKATVVYLDGSWRSEPKGGGDGSVVRLPNGQAVGWRDVEN